MSRNLTARFWRFSALGLGAVALFNGVLLGQAWLGFSLARPEYFNEAWPTFSRALTIGNLTLYRWLAGMAGAGLLAGAAALAVMHYQRSRAQPRARGTLTIMALGAALASALGIVHYFHVAITLNVDLDGHMQLSYLFFFGMSGVIATDWFCARRLAHLLPPEALDRLLRLRHACGVSVFGASAVFLLTYVLKDVAANPWAAATQRVFVASETAWIVLAHAYAVLYLPAAREHFGAQLRRQMPAGASKVEA
jgi:hypothetical protein